MSVISYIQNFMNKNKAQTDENKASGNYEDVFQKIDEIEKEYEPKKPTLPENEKYERIDYVAPSDSEIESNAKASLEGYYSDGTQSIENEIASLITKYTADKTSNKTAYDKTLKNLESAYASAIEEARYDALKRGLARSSVAANTTGALLEGKAKAETETTADYETKQADIDAKISELGVKKQKAMDEFNIAYTAKLTEEINELKAEREKLKTEAVKYNNSLAEKENKEKITKAKTESELYTEELNQRAAKEKLSDDTAEKEQRYQRIYTVLRDKLLTMSAAEAKTEITKNPIYSQYLSSAYYYKLFDEFGR